MTITHITPNEAKLQKALEMQALTIDAQAKRIAERAYRPSYP